MDTAYPAWAALLRPVGSGWIDVAAAIAQPQKDGGAQGLLQDPGGPEDRLREGHQSGLPQACDAVAPGQDAELAGAPSHVHATGTSWNAGNPCSVAVLSQFASLFLLCTQLFWELQVGCRTFPLQWALLAVGDDHLPPGPEKFFLWSPNKNVFL